MSVKNSEEKKVSRRKTTGGLPEIVLGGGAQRKLLLPNNQSEMYAPSAKQHLSSTLLSALLFCLVLWSHAAEANVNAARIGHAAEANVKAARVGHALHLRSGELTCEDKPKWYKPEGRGCLSTRLQPSSA